MSLTTLFSILQTIIVLVIVIALANITLKLLKNQMNKQNRIIKVIERVAINNNSALGVVEICGKYYLMSFTNNENTILKELDKNQIEEIVEEMEMDQSFPSYEESLGKVKEYFGMRK